MKRYLKNLIAALCDRNPFQEELEEKNIQLDKAVANVSALQDQLYAALNKWDGCQLELVDAKRELEDTKRALSEAECTTSCKQLS